MGSSTEKQDFDEKIADLVVTGLKMKYFVFKLNSKFPYDKLIQRLKANQNFNQNHLIDGKTFAKILVALEIRTDD